MTIPFKAPLKHKQIFVPFGCEDIVRCVYGFIYKWVFDFSGSASTTLVKDFVNLVLSLLDYLLSHS